MIVFPQTYNYRLIIGSLIIAISVLSVYSFYNHEKLQDYKTYLAQEKKLIQNELSEIITRFDTLEVENKALNQQLEVSKAKVKNALDSLNGLSVSTNLLAHYRSRINSLKEEKNNILNLVQNLEEKNKRLSVKVEQSEQQLIEVKNQTNKLLESNSKLKNNNLTLANKVEIASQLQISRLEAQAVKRITKNKVIPTDNSKRASKMLVEFVIPKNKLLEKGEKELYIQILNPDNNVVSDQGVVKFNDESLIFSKKIKVKYIGQDINIKTFIETNLDEPFKKGIYFVSVFNKKNRIGSTTITLN